jgi:hypothetical protein
MIVVVWLVWRIIGRFLGFGVAFWRYLMVYKSILVYFWVLLELKFIYLDIIIGKRCF